MEIKGENVSYDLRSVKETDSSASPRGLIGATPAVDGCGPPLAQRNKKRRGAVGAHYPKMVAPLGSNTTQALPMREALKRGDSPTAPPPRHGRHRGDLHQAQRRQPLCSSKVKQQLRYLPSRSTPSDPRLVPTMVSVSLDLVK